MTSLRSSASIAVLAGTAPGGDNKGGLPNCPPTMAAMGPSVELVGRTAFLPPTSAPFVTDADGGQALAEFAGRAIYRSWQRSNPATDTNASFLRHLIEVGHLSVLEHSGATLYLTGIATHVAHELLRHRHFSISELSPRTNPTGPEAVAIPPALAASEKLRERFLAAAGTAQLAFHDLVAMLREQAGDAVDGALAHKQARQAAGAVLPRATTTDLVVTGNDRAWRHFIGMRGTDAADVALRELAVAVLEVLAANAPHLYADFRISELPDGTRTAASPYVGEG